MLDFTKMVLKHEGTEKGQAIGPLFLEDDKGETKPYGNLSTRKWYTKAEAKAIAKEHNLPLEVF